MQLTPHFSLEELTITDHRWIDNTLPVELLGEAKLTAQFMETIRSELSRVAGHDVPIEVTSAYRCPALNTAVGSKPTSDHPHMAAVDFKCPSFGSPRDVARALVPLVNVLGIGQLIYEIDWCHVSRIRVMNPINRILTINRGAAPVVGIR